MQNFIRIIEFKLKENDIKWAQIFWSLDMKQPMDIQ